MGRSAHKLSAGYRASKPRRVDALPDLPAAALIPSIYDKCKLSQATRSRSDESPEFATRARFCEKTADPRPVRDRHATSLIS